MAPPVKPQDDPYAEFSDVSKPPAVTVTRIGNRQIDPYAEFVDAPEGIPQRQPSAEQFTGFSRDVGPAMAMLTPQQKKEALKTGVELSAGMAAPVALGRTLKFAADVTGRFAPTITQFGRAIESGGLAPGLSVPQRVAGSAVSGGVGAGVVDPDQIMTGATIGVLTPVAAQVTRPFVKVFGATKQVEKEYKAAYKAAEDVGATVAPTQFNNLVSQMKDTAAKFQFLPNKHKEIDNALTTFGQQADLQQPVSIERIDNLRRDLNKARFSGDKVERDIAKNMLGDLDGFVRQTFPTQVSKNIELARDLFTRAQRSEAVDNIIEKARVAKGREPAEVIKEEFYRISQGKGKYAALKRQFTADEQAVIKSIGNGRLDINALEGIGAIFAPPRVLRPNIRELPKALGQATTTGLGTARIGPEMAIPIAIGVGGTGYLSRAMANRLAAARASQFGARVATGRVPNLLAPESFAPIIPAGTSYGVNFLAEQQRLAEQGF